jgi:putative methionine-R-sulfoxide reductase with GAF domain/HAMP domain-containing protein
MLRNSKTALPNTLRRRMLIIFGGAAVMLFLVTFSGLLTQALSRYINIVGSRQLAVTRQGAISVSSYIEELTSQLELFTLLEAGSPEGYSDSLDKILGNNPAFLEVVIFDLDGNSLAAATRNEVILNNLFTLRQSNWFQRASAGETYVGDLQISPQNTPYSIFSVPLNNEGLVEGVLVLRVGLDAIGGFLTDLDFSETGTIYLINDDGIIIAHSDANLVLSGESTKAYIDLYDPELIANGSKVYPNLEGLLSEPSTIALVPILARQGWWLVTEIPRREGLADVREIIPYVLGLGILLLAVTLFTIDRFAWQLANPIEKLTNAVDAYRRGELDTAVDEEGVQELRNLSAGFNAMRVQLQKTLSALEIQNRGLEISIEVSRRLNSILEPNQLVREVVAEIRKSFDYYHVQIYLLNTTRDRLVLVGGTGNAGALMIANDHTLTLNEGLVGRAARDVASVWEPDVSQASDWKSNPFLPNTKSELATPVFVQEELLGVLDIQQDSVNGINADDVRLLESIASQVAVALQNARSFQLIQRSVQKQRTLNLITERLQRATTVEELLETASRAVGEALEIRETVVMIERPKSVDDPGESA